MLREYAAHTSLPDKFDVPTLVIMDGEDDSKCDPRSPRPSLSTFALEHRPTVEHAAHPLGASRRGRHAARSAGRRPRRAALAEPALAARLAGDGIGAAEGRVDGARRTRLLRAARAVCAGSALSSCWPVVLL